MQLNRKGQAYSTFKLLIAASVAMAILAILIPIIMKVMGIIKADPTQETTKLISTLVEQPGTLQKTDLVAFNTKTSTLAGRALAEKTTVSSDQICMSLGAFQHNSEFRLLAGEKEHKIIYLGNQERTAKIAVICNVDRESLMEDIESYANEDTPLLEFAGSIDVRANCGCADTGTCCAVILQRA